MRLHGALLFSVVILLAPSLASAQEVKTQDDQKSDKIVDTKFVLVAGSLAGSTIFDMETTFAALKREGVHEGNPIMRPFVQRGRPAAYVVVSGLDAGIIYASYRIKKSANPNMQKLWWVMPVAATVSHGLAGGFNLRFAVTF